MKIARLDRKVIRRAKAQLEKNTLRLSEDWFATRKGKRVVNWSKIPMPDVAGVYALRIDHRYPKWRHLKKVHLHGSKTIGKVIYQPETFKECNGWVYVGTTGSGIRTRFQRHLSRTNVSGHMIYKAMKSFFGEKDPVAAVLKYGRLNWIALPGSENAVNRFFVEVKLIVEHFPLFNAKTEH